MYDIAYSKSATNFLKKVPTKEQRRIRAAITGYAKRPKVRSHQVRKLKSRNGYRLRVGRWRAIFDLDGKTMRILDIGPRGSIYS